MSEDVSTKIQVAGRNYPVIVTKVEMLHLGRIEKEINEKINELKTQYKDLDTQDCLALYLINQKMDFLPILNAQPQNENLDSIITEIEMVLNTP